MNVLVGYATAHGSTREIAERIGARARRGGSEGRCAVPWPRSRTRTRTRRSCSAARSMVRPGWTRRRTFCAATANCSASVLCGFSAWGCPARCAGRGSAWRQGGNRHHRGSAGSHPLPGPIGSCRVSSSPPAACHRASDFRLMGSGTATTVTGRPLTPGRMGSPGSFAPRDGFAGPSGTGLCMFPR